MLLLFYSNLCICVCLFPMHFILHSWGLVFLYSQHYGCFLSLVDEWGIDTSITINGCGGEEDSPTSTAAKGSSSNWTLISMKYLLVLKLISLYPSESSEYPTNMHSLLWGCKAFLLSVGILAQAFEPKILKWVTSGLCPLQALKGVIPSSFLWGTLLWM